MDRAGFGVGNHAKTKKPINTMKTEKTIKSEDSRYNGWTNYATWRVNLEIFDGMNTEDGFLSTADECKDYAETMLIDECGDCLALNYALAFLQDVNWHEISEGIND